MNRLYFIILICAIVFGAYFYGVNITEAKCKLRFVNENLQNQNNQIQKQREIHDVVYKMVLGDVRRILRDKYTIAE